MKKLLLIALVIMIVIQLFIPIYMIASKYDILSNGEEYKFVVNPVDPYDAFRGRYVSLNPLTISRNQTGKYGIIRVDEDGFAYVHKVTNEKPKNETYVKSIGTSWFRLPIDRYYMDEKLAPRAETIIQQNGQRRETYVTVRIKNGNLVVSGLFIDGIAIEDILKENTK